MKEKIHAQFEKHFGGNGTFYASAGRINPQFEKHFGGNGTFYASAGRINLIGEHTDYNGGFVFPGAIDKGMMAEIRLNGTDKVRVYSVDLEDYAEFGFAEADAPTASWARYVFGVCREIIKRCGDVLKGFDAAFAGDVPLGAGMSSSAALESTFAYALNDMLGLGIDKFEGPVRLHLRQGRQPDALGLPLDGVQVLSVPSQGLSPRSARLSGQARAGLIGLQQAPRLLRACSGRPQGRRASRGGVPVDMQMLSEVKGKVSDEDYMRAEYVIEEIQRVLDVCDALERDDYETVGQKMYETHHGMSKLYEVSCEELDFLNDIARECGVTGSRVMGGGFGGCTINLVKDELYDAFIARAKKEYAAKFGHEPKIYPVVISDGARKLE